MSTRPYTLGVDLSAIVGRVFGERFLAATFNKVVPGTYNPANPAGGNQPTTTQYPCRALITDWGSVFFPKDGVRRFKGKLAILGDSLEKSTVMPQPGDSLIIVCPDGIARTLTLNEVNGDGVGASYVCDYTS